MKIYLYTDKQKNVLETTRSPYPMILLAGLALAFFLLGFLLSQYPIVKGKKFDEYRNTNYATVYIDITSFPIAFDVLTNERTETFYIVSNDKNKYIVKLNQPQYRKIKKKYEHNKNDFQYRIVGRSYSIFENIKKASLNAYNNDKKENIITVSNYEIFFGQTYIDGTDNLGMVVGYTLFILGSVFAVVFLLSTINFIYIQVKLNRAIKIYGEENLEMHLDDSKTLAYQKEGIYLTGKYLISNCIDFIVLPYDNIFWIYIADKTIYFVSMGKFLLIATKDGKLLQVAASRNIKILEEIITKIHEKIPSVLIGDSKENHNSYKNYLKLK